MTISAEFLAQLNSLSDSDLRRVNSIIVDKINMATKSRRRQAASKLSIGDRVKFTDKMGRTVKGTVSKVNRVNVKVDTEVGRWNVTASLLTRI